MLLARLAMAPRRQPAGSSERAAAAPLLPADRRAVWLAPGAVGCDVVPLSRPWPKATLHRACACTKASCCRVTSTNEGWPHWLADRGNANAALRVTELKKRGMTFNPQAGAAAASCICSKVKNGAEGLAEAPVLPLQPSY